MKLKFTKQDYQMAAVQSVVDLFKGQEKLKETFSVEKGNQLSLYETGLGIKNCLTISKERLLENLHEVQKRNGLQQTDDIDYLQFSIEMETGTGKTYVFVRTIYELNRLYGFTKFIIVVPSIPIREGDYKFLEITREHFAADYDRTPIRYFIYNSARLSDVRQFATSGNIEVMIINIDAFKKAENIINQAQDKLNGDSAMSFIRDTNPILIIDEPQSVDHTEKAKEALAGLNPLFTFRYSATFRDITNLIYRLTPVDAFEMGLVKQISVVSSQAGSDVGGEYIRLVSVSNDNGFKARIEIDKQNSDKKVERKTVTVRHNSDLYELSGGREVYDGYVVTGIDCTKGFEAVEFDNAKTIKLGQTIGGVDELLIKKEQIRRTIEIHLQKELLYYEKGIKVLSLFFIDRVANYRGEEGEKGIFAKLFEEAYEDLLSQPRFAPLKEKFPFPVEKVHGGYFSQDKKGRLKNTKGDTNDDADTYNTIMKDKEWLLSFDCPLRFLFSHSALKEGWDNPNVFQVCTLIEQKSLFTCRQKIGRGMRLCVNQNGDRVTDRNINILHVMANESFAEFADKLQKEYEEDTGIRFGIINISLFSGITYTETVKEEKTVEEDTTQKILAFYKEAGLTDDTGIITKKAIKEAEKEAVPEEIQELRPVLEAMAQKGEPIQSMTGMCYTVEKQKEKSFAYEDAKEVLEHFEEKEYISKSGKIKDTMKEDFASVYLPSLYYSEIGTAKRINEIISSSGTKKVKYNESLLKLTYDDIQKEAIKLSTEAKFMVLTGGPGTGKTTTINGIIQIFSKSGLKVILTAPTGRAAKRMAETTGLEAKTIHRLLEYNKSGKYQKNEKNQLKGDAIIIDESSMIDIVLMYNLLKAVPNSMRVVMVGDKDQLPSVGPGNVLKDIIESNVVPVVTLNNVYRQASKSDIIKNAHLINKGICPYIPKKQQGNFFFIEEKCTENIPEIIRKLVLERLPKFYHVSPMNDIFVLSPVLNGEAGVNNLNNILQKALNKNKIGIKYKGIDYKLGDRVMQVRNNYDKEVYNGDIGRISNIDFNNRTIKVLFDNKETIYKMNELSELVPAYAMTVHKSQGSEFPIIVIPLIKEFKGMLQRNLLYTAITRAKNILVIVGDKDAFELSIKNDNTEKRNTKLREELKAFNNQL